MARVRAHPGRTSVAVLRCTTVQALRPQLRLHAEVTCQRWLRFSPVGRGLMLPLSFTQQRLSFLISSVPARKLTCLSPSDCTAY